MNKINLNLDVYVSGAMLGFGILTFASSRKMVYWSGYGPGEAFVSSWSSGFLIVLSVISIIKSLNEKGVKLRDILPKGNGLKNLLVTWGASIIFLFTVAKVGFIVASLIMLFLLYSRGYKWYYAILTSVIVTLVCFIVFKVLLQVPLPVNQYGW